MSSRLVFLNFAIDPKRRSELLQKFHRRLNDLELTCTDNLATDDFENVRVIVNKTRELNDNDVQRFPKLKLIVVFGAEKWMLSLSAQDPVIDVRTLNLERGTEVAEVAVALMLIGLKKLLSISGWRHLLRPKQVYNWLFPREATETTGAHNWTHMETRSAYRKKIGIIGYGLIGRAIHRRLEGFSCDVAYYHPTRYSSELERTIAISYLSLPEMFVQCDVVFVQTPLNSSTENLIDRRILERAKPGLIIINCGRARVINEEDLYQALKNGIVGFYGADVFWREPVAPWNRFLRLSNVLITPHMSESLSAQPDLTENVIDLIVEFCHKSF